MPLLLAASAFGLGRRFLVFYSTCYLQQLQSTTRMNNNTNNIINSRIQNIESQNLHNNNNLSTHNMNTNTQPFYSSLDFVQDNTSEPVPEETFTHSHLSRSSVALICFIHLTWSMVFSLFNECARQSFPQSLSKFSLEYLLTWHPPLHTQYISSPDLFTAHAYTNLFCCSAESLHSSAFPCTPSMNL